MSTETRRHFRYLLAIFGFAALATVVGAYILDQQRLRWPWEDVFRIEASFDRAQAVVPGQGQTVNVAGVRVGEVEAVRLEDGRAIVEMALDNDELGPVYRDATALIRPKTGLNDMSIQLDPGTQSAGELPERGRIRAGNTLPNVNPDEVLAALDSDTRRWLAILSTAGGQGLGGNGEALREVLKAGQPGFERGARVARAVAARRRELTRLVRNLRRLSRATAARDERLAELVESASVVLSAIGGREAELRASMERLPGALAATRSALRDTRGLVAQAEPALRELRPLARELGPALVQVRPLLEDGTPVLRDELRPLVRETVPLLRRLRPALTDIRSATPDLVTTGGDLNYVVNELGYNPPGPEEGYAFWAAWFFNNASSILSVEDAHGSTWRGLVIAGCSTLGEVVAASPALQPLADAAVCPEPPGAP